MFEGVLGDCDTWSTAPTSIISTQVDSDDASQVANVGISNLPNGVTVDELREVLIKHGMHSDFARRIDLRKAPSEGKQNRALIRCDSYSNAMSIFHSLQGVRVSGSLVNVCVKSKTWNDRKNRTKVPESGHSPSSPNRRGPESTCKIFIGGLKSTTSSKTLRQYFTKFGDIKDCGVVYDFKGVSRRFAYCEFLKPDAVVDVLEYPESPHRIEGVVVGVRSYCLRD